MRLGYFLSCEEHPPEELVRQARLAEEHGFESLWISDHFHPWNDEQGQSPLVWSVIGALSQVTSLPVTTAVTCPTMRVHPAIVAQAAATSSRLLPGGLRLGVGSGEALNEHVVGARWAPTDVRLEMLEEAIDVLRALLSGDRVDHHGRHFTVEDARLYTLPERPVPIYVSGFGPKALALAAHKGDGLVTTKPSSSDIAAYRTQGGRGVVEAGVKFCYGPDVDEAAALAHRLWANQGLPGRAVAGAAERPPLRAGLRAGAGGGDARVDRVRPGPGGVRRGHPRVRGRGRRRAARRADRPAAGGVLRLLRPGGPAAGVQRARRVRVPAPSAGAQAVDVVGAVWATGGRLRCPTTVSSGSWLEATPAS